MGSSYISRLFLITKQAFQIKRKWFIYPKIYQFLSIGRASQNTNHWKYLAILHTKMSFKLFIIQLLFFSAKSFCSFPIRWERQSRWRRVARAADWFNRFFLPYKITNCPNNRTILQEVWTLFARYLYCTFCCWIIILRAL